MEYGPNEEISEREDKNHTNNGVIYPIMANLPTEEGIEEKIPVVNGDSELISNQEDNSSESDALVIDESAPVKRKKPNSPTKNTDIISHHFNPYFNESLFELSQQHQQPPKFHQRLKKLKKNSPKLREYAQYLGLQPTVQFKCSKCNRAGFESLTSLNHHISQCTDEPLDNPQVPELPSSSFKLTRKVFLCSACGTYYENWNLYLHMLEVHRRYLCLYCLGMFSVLDDLCLHIQSRHNLEPGHKDNLDDFFNAYSDPCYLVCCECNQLFNEQENFFYHTCVKLDKLKVANNQKITNKTAKNKTLIRPEDHVTGDSTQNTQFNGDFNKQIDLNQVPIEIDRECQSDNFEVLLQNIIYSSDSELDFKGYASDGEPVYKVIENVSNEKMIENNIMEDEEAIVEDEQMDIVGEPQIEPIETRKVPKLSLKLKPGSFPEIEHHSPLEEENVDEKIDDYNEEPPSDPKEEPEAQIDSFCEDQLEKSEERTEEEPVEVEPQIQVAGTEIAIIELELEQPLDKFDIRVLLQKCLNATAPTCIYCNHARKIAVNGQQLGLHAISQHRFSAVVHSITAEELIPESFNARITESLPSLENVFFSLESSQSDEGVTFSHVFECFQCRYSSTVHKELYLHNRKSHAKNLILCIMCKLNFYSYSELICHLCPGVYIWDYDVQFRCCMCVGDDIPSAFRLMVHLRKRHHVCDVCLEMCHTQYKLSNHVWKHKLHHFCYRCGIAYRNKPDITRHLFWKHGTESVLCKKCLQKKWPHVYHFCMPPVNFQCDECSLSFSRAVCLKVHKRAHADLKPHACTIENCEEKFISKKLLEKHEQKHKEPDNQPVEEPELIGVTNEEETEPKKIDEAEKKEEIEEKEKVVAKPKVDVYDLPALNLSESDSSDSENETEDQKKYDLEMKDETEGNQEITEVTNGVIEENDGSNEIVLENIWDNFKNYQANKEKFDHLLTVSDDKEIEDDISQPETEKSLTTEVALRDHDYCIDPENKLDVTFTEATPDLSQSVDHDYCTSKEPMTSTTTAETSVQEKPQKKEDAKKQSSSSDSSSDSDSSSCSCGPNCSCSSSSGSSSSSSDSSNSDSSTEEGRKRQQLRRDRRRQRKNKNKPQDSVKQNVPVNDKKVLATIPEIVIQESDLETTESETDEEFYDKKPQIYAKKILEERRNQILAGIEQTPNGSLIEGSRPPTPNIPVEEEPIKQKKKSKSKKKKKKKNKLKNNTSQAPYYQYYQPPVAPITLTLTRNSPVPVVKPPTTPIYTSQEGESSKDDTDGSLRASKRRRVPNKFYGYSSDEDDDKSSPKWRKADLPQPIQHSSQMIVPPITIKAGPPAVQPFSIKATQPGQMRVQPVKKLPPLKIRAPKTEEVESEVESNDSSNEGRNVFQVNRDALYCYCKCPYDEVSEMIGCDSRDCSIEWFHFECVGIMVPPKGHWYCPECRKKRQQKRDNILKLKAKT